MKKIILSATVVALGCALPSTAFAYDGEKSEKTASDEKQKKKKAKKKAVKAVRSSSAYRIRTTPM